MIGRYDRVAMTLHWTIAAALFALAPMGWWMSRAIDNPADQANAYRAFQLHKSIGLLVLVLTLIRIAWRLRRSPPTPPAASPLWERWAAKGVHGGFYALLLLLPLSGWLYVSTGWSAPLDRPLQVATAWFGLVRVPHLPVPSESLARRDLAFQALGAHAVLAWGGVGLIALHVGAALKHQFKDRDGVMAAMVPWLAPHAAADSVPTARWPALAGGLGVISLALFAGLITAAPPGAPSMGPSPAAPVTAASPPSALTSEPPGTATTWTVDEAGSEITFSGEHAGDPFKGRFERWDARIWFSPDDLGGSKAVILVQTGSARTGDATQEASLTEGEWFSPAAFPTARFEASRFRALGGDRYQAEGELQVKDRRVPITLPFQLAQSGGQAHVEAEIQLDRTALGLGLISDPRAEWVSRMITVRIRVTAKAA